MDLQDQKSERVIGGVLAASMFVAIFAILHHPDGFVSASGDIPSAENSDFTVLKLIHGFMIALLILMQFAMTTFWGSIPNRIVSTRLGLITFTLGSMSFLVAAVFSGFVLPTLIDSATSQSAVEAASYPSTFQFSFAINQVFGKLGAVAFGAAAVFSAVSLWGSKPLDRTISITSVIAGVVLIFSAFSIVDLDVQKMTMITIALSVWLAGVGVHMLIADPASRIPSQSVSRHSSGLPDFNEKRN